MSDYLLPIKLFGHLRRLLLTYEEQGEAKLHWILQRAYIFVREETEHDNWDGGIDGHDVVVFLDVSDLSRIALEEQEGISDRLKDDLNKSTFGIQREYIRAVTIEPSDENDPEFQASRSIEAQPAPDVDSLTIWEPGHIRLFISHRDGHKVQAKALSKALSEFGICGFVAHDTIQVMDSWQHTILDGLRTMEIMLAFITDDFRDSWWTNQEVGFALGRNIPIVSIKLEAYDPSGFIAEKQALRGRIENAAGSASEIYNLLADKLGNKERLQSGLVSAFASSSTFNESIQRLRMLNGKVSALSDSEITTIEKGYQSNDQLYGCGAIHGDQLSITSFMTRVTGRAYTASKRILEAKDDLSDEIPF